MSITEYLARQPWIEIKISNEPDPAVDDPRSFALLIEVESNYVKDECDGVVSQTKTSKYVKENLSNDELLDLIKLLYSICEEK